MNISQPVPVVVAAGGKGRRMAGNKPAQILAGVSLIEMALTQACSMSATVAVAVQEKPIWPLPEGVEFLCDEQPDAGPLSALTSALQWAGIYHASHVLLLPCDMPFLPGDLLARLTDAATGNAVAVAKSSTRVHPICALWPTSALAVVQDYAQNSRRSLIGFAERLGLIGVEWSADPVDPFFNINTPDDLEYAHRLLASGAISI